MLVTARIWAVTELALACAAVLGCAISWSAVRSSVVVEPVAKGQPTTTSVVYDPPLLLLTLLLAATAGMLAVTGTARLRRVNRHRPGRQPNRSSG